MVKILSALICCGIANWFVFDRFSGPEKYFCMLLVALICLVLIIVHRRRTKDWCNDGHDDYDEDHSMIFVPSTFASFVAILFGLFSCASLGFFVGVLTFGIPCGIISKREIEYVW